MDGEKYDRLAKILLIGDSGVGKTCFLLRFVSDEHRVDHLPTVGIDFKMKTIAVADARVKLQIWDTAGQDRFQTLTGTFFKGAHGVLLLYSITDRKSFNNVDNWIKQVAELASADVSVVLVANKTDLVHDREITFEEGRELANRYKAPFIEASAFDGTNVEAAFVKLGETVLARTGRQAETPAGHQIGGGSGGQGKSGKKKCCKT